MAKFTSTSCHVTVTFQKAKRIIKLGIGNHMLI